MELTLNETQLTKLADLYNRNDQKASQYETRMFQAIGKGDNVLGNRMYNFKEQCHERERAYDDVLKILGLRVVTDEDDPEGMYKIVRR